jgi:Ca2+-binding EF-hand superfamily protein
MNRRLLAAFVLLVLATSVDAQKRRGKASARPPAASRAGKAPKGADPSPPPIYLPGFDQPAKGAKKAAPAGPKPKAKAPAKGEPPKPADPMKEADRVTAAADHLTEVDKARQQFLAEHFRVCDLDASGWLSLREVEVTLSLGRAEYRRMDANQDGRLDEAEFSTQSELLLARLGATLTSKDAPKPAPETLAEPPVDGPVEPAPAEAESPQPDDQGPKTSEERALGVRPSDLLRRYDVDQSAGIDATEIERLFAEAGLVLSPELVVAQMDPDDSGQLESGELIAIAWLVSRHVPEALRPAPPTDDLGGQPPSAESGPARQNEPGALVPTHFARLDPGHDGFIDEADLRALQSPSRLDLRFRALLSAMDQDGDGRLSEAEFRGSMRAAKR